MRKQIRVVNFISIHAILSGYFLFSYISVWIYFKIFINSVVGISPWLRANAPTLDSWDRKVEFNGITKN